MPAFAAATFTTSQRLNAAEAIRIISARQASRRERAAYASKD
jgi:uncharacterized DUF497 family protein